MTEFNLSEKIRYIVGNDCIRIKDVKEKIQNAQKRLKEEFDNNDWENNTLDVPENRNLIIDKIFKECFGEKLI